MTKQAIIERTIDAINRLPEDKAEEISDFADFVIKRYEELTARHEERTLGAGLQNLASGQSFDFLKDEEDLYSEEDLKEVYNGKG